MKERRIHDELIFWSWAYLYHKRIVIDRTIFVNHEWSRMMTATLKRRTSTPSGCYYRFGRKRDSTFHRNVMSFRTWCRQPTWHSWSSKSFLLETHLLKTAHFYFPKQCFKYVFTIWNTYQIRLRMLSLQNLIWVR